MIGISRVTKNSKSLRKRGDVGEEGREREEGARAKERKEKYALDFAFTRKQTNKRTHTSLHTLLHNIQHTLTQAYNQETRAAHTTATIPSLHTHTRAR